MKVHMFLSKFTISRPMTFSKVKKVEPGSEISIKTIDAKGKECKKEIQISKETEGLFRIELVYIAECEGGDEKDYEKRIRSHLAMEANLLVSNVLRELHIPPFPLLLGDFSNGKDKDK